MRTLALLMALAIASVFSACLEAGVKDRCRTSTDCLAGRLCVDERCVDAPDAGDFCDDSCLYAEDGVCDDGSSGAATNLCDVGTDCSDCTNPQLQRSCTAICPEDDTGCNEGVCMARADRVLDGYLCSEGAPCPTAQVCQFGYCVRECDGSLDCFRSFCVEDTPRYCAPEGETDCSLENPCEGAHTCHEGVCVLPGSEPCTADAECDALSQCLFVRGEKRCSAVPFCGGSLRCDEGTTGVLCNVDVIATKGPICLQGHCLTGEDCADAHDCLRAEDTLSGRCSNHTLASFCVTSDDCSDGECARADGADPYGRCE